MLSKSFKPGKCKTSLKLTMARIKVLKYAKEAQVKQMKRDLALLLEAGHVQIACIRVEHVVREEKTMAAYDIIELYCEVIVARLPIIESQKNCPVDLKEAISSIIFASPRCADILELQDVRKHFVAKYGKEFTTAALELRPECGVNHTIIEKLSVRTPDGETKIKILTTIAHEHNVRWDPAALGEQFFKPSEDLLNGPNKFASAAKMPIESYSIRPQPPARENDEPATKSENGSTRRSPESKPGMEDCRNPFYKDKNPSIFRQNWNMQFSDAATAAQAAAESAERATMAARAAAELSNREKIKRECLTGSHESPMHGHGDKGARRPISSMWEAADSKVQGKLEAGSSYWTKMHRNQKRDQNIEGHLLEVAESRYDDHGSVKNKTSRSSSHSSLTSIEDNSPTFNLQKLRGSARNSSFESQVVGLDQQRKGVERGAFLGEGSFNEKSSLFTSSSSKVSFDDDISDVNLHKPNAYRFPQRGFSEEEYLTQNQMSKKTHRAEAIGRIQNEATRSASSQSSTSSIPDYPLMEQNPKKYGHDDDGHYYSITGHGNAKRGSHQAISRGYSAAAIDKPDADSGSDLELEGNSCRYESKSRFPIQVTKPTSYLSSHVDPRSPRQQKCKSGIFPRNSKFLSSQSDDFLTEASYDCNGLGFEREEEKNNFILRGRKESGSSHLKQTVPTKVMMGSNTWSNLSSEDSESDKESIDNNQEAEPNVVSVSWKRQGPHLLHSNHESWKRHGPCLSQGNQPFPRHSESSRKANNVDSKLFYSSMVEEQHHLQSSRLSAKEVRTLDGYEELPSPVGTNKSSEFSDSSSNESGNKLNLGRLMGGRRNKVISQLPYMQNRSGDASLSSKQQMVEERLTTFQEPTTISPSLKTSMNSEARNHELYMKAPKESDSYDANEVQPHRNVGSGDNEGGEFSHRRTDFPSQSGKRTPLKFTGGSGAPLHSDFGAGRLSQAPLSGSIENSKARHPNSSIKIENPIPAVRAKRAPPQEPPKTVEGDESPKLASLNQGSTMRENSLRRPGHVHPKLPDYDILKAQFESLRTNQRSQ